MDETRRPRASCACGAGDGPFQTDPKHGSAGGIWIENWTYSPLSVAGQLQVFADLFRNK